MERKHRYLAVILAMLFVCPPLPAFSAESSKRVLLISSRPQSSLPADAYEPSDVEIQWVNMPLPTTQSSDPLETHFKRGQRLFSKAKRAYENIEFDSALTYLKQARRYSKPEMLREIFFMEAVIYQSLQQIKKAVFSLKAYILFQGRTPDSAIYPPELIQLYKRARLSLEKSERVNLTISPVTQITTPIEIRINGKASNSTQYVQPGYYFVEVDQLGTQRFAELVYVGRRGKRMRVRLNSASHKALVSEALQVENKSDRNLLFQILQKRTKTDGVLLLENQKAEFFVAGQVVWSNSRIQNDRLASLDIQKIKKVLGSESSSMIASLAHTPSANGTNTNIKSESASWYQTWWFWTLVGAAAAGAGGAVYMMNQGGDQPETIHLSVQGQ